jgi:ABC-type multidrug transport system ATPase subunit
LSSRDAAKVCCELRDLRVGYSGPPVLDGLWLTVMKGEAVAVLGANGSGKTTLARSVSGLLAPRQGTVSVCGRNVTGVGRPAGEIGLMLGGYGIVGQLTPIQNLELCLRAAGADITDAQRWGRQYLEMVRLEPVERKSVAHLSAGEQQRLALARALATRRPLIVLDDPLSSVDTELQAALVDDVRQYQASTGTTMLIATRDREISLSLADRVVNLRCGSLENETQTR